MLSLIRFSEDKINEINFTDEEYLGLDNNNTTVRVFYSHKKSTQSIIIFPGASPYAEEHPGMIMLANALRNVGFNVFLPRIPNLKNLLIVTENVPWFEHCYLELLKHRNINSSPMVVGLSYGGANLLKSSLSKSMQNNPPKSILSYGTYFSIESALDFFVTGNITYNHKSFHITPHEWGTIVIFYNFIRTIETNHDQEKITKLLKYRIEDNDLEVDKTKKSLNDNDKKLIEKILTGKIDHNIKLLIDQMIDQNRDLLEYLSPQKWAKNISTKTFIIHGANDSMVPFTESVLLAKNINNSELLISFLYEHREISTNRGILFKMKEAFKMIRFFAFYFRYNK
tara:strand:+ start:127 stop:1146 length:1020 start_codon:yes stop_codon:yes gene_type:complete